MMLHDVPDCMQTAGLHVIIEAQTSLQRTVDRWSPSHSYCFKKLDQPSENLNFKLGSQVFSEILSFHTLATIGIRSAAHMGWAKSIAPQKVFKTTSRDTSGPIQASGNLRWNRRYERDESHAFSGVK